MDIRYYLFAIPVFGLIIVAHELGHFLVAKAAGIRVEEFAIGFGPAFASFRWGETRYALRLLLPLGGMVRLGEDQDAEEHDPRAFNNQPLGKRAAVIAAGPFMNFVLAVVLYALLFGTLGDPVPVVNRVLPDMPAAAAGLQASDRIVQINGQAVSSWESMVCAIAASGGKPLSLQVNRGGAVQSLQIVPKLSPDEPGQCGYTEHWVVGIEPAYQGIGLFKSLYRGVVQTFVMVVTWFYGLAMMFTGHLKPEVSGPVGITQAIAEAGRSGLNSLLHLSAFLSINIGIMNLIPIPALDGSRLMFMFVEWIRGKRINPQRENLVHFVGLVVLMALTLLITYSELVKR